MINNVRAVCADSLEWMKTQQDGSYDLIVADPPYNVGKDYGNNSDSAEKEQQREFSRAWLQEASRLLCSTGTIYVFMGVRNISYIYYILEDVLGLDFNSWICWHYTQGLGKRRSFSNRHDDILMFTKTRNYTFNLDDVRVPQKYYRSVNNMRGANPGDVWEISHVHYCQYNRQPHPTQKPEGLLERMIRASSNPGDRVLDPFSGSGTTLRVCQQLDRHCDGIEINPVYVEDVKKRLALPFDGFDSIDPRMKRVPRDLNDDEVRQTYIENHVKWFLDHHEGDIKDYMKEVNRMYPSRETSGQRRSRAKGRAENSVGLFSSDGSS